MSWPVRRTTIEARRGIRLEKLGPVWSIFWTAGDGQVLGWNHSCGTFLPLMQASRYSSERLARAIFNRLNAPEAGRQFRERNAINPQEVSQ